MSDGILVRRAACPREACRAAWGEYRSLGIYASGETVAHCHPWQGLAIEHRAIERELGLTDRPLSEAERRISAMIERAENIAEAAIELASALRDGRR